MKKFKAIIIDDEKLGRELIKSYLSGYPEFTTEAECSDGFEGLKAIREINPDIIFLDIQMPKLSGLEMLELIDVKPFVVLVTAYDEFAVQAFEFNALDYLLKPVEKERFDITIKRFLTEHRVNAAPREPLNESSQKITRIVLKEREKVIIIPLEKILYIEAQDDYVMIHTDEGKHLRKQTMKYFDEALDPENFIRIHRSYIININHISGIELFEKDLYYAVMNNGKKLPLSRQGYSKLKEKLI